MSTWLSLLVKQKTYEITELLPETKYTVSINGTYNEPIEVWLTTLAMGEDGIIETEVNQNNAVYVGDLENNKLTFTAQESHTALVVRTLGDLELNTIKLEKGTIATDWTLAPEEQEQRLSIIEQTADGIRLEVSELKEVNTNTAQLQIQAGEISSKVSTNGVISAINQTAESFKINANRIEFEGTVTANNNFKILPDGTIEAVNAKLSGNITATKMISATDNRYYGEVGVSGKYVGLGLYDLRHGTTPYFQVLEMPTNGFLITDYNDVRRFSAVNAYTRIKNSNNTISFDSTTSGTRIVFGNSEIGIDNTGPYYIKVAVQKFISNEKENNDNEK